MHVIYVDVPSDYFYEWDTTHQSGDDVLTRDFSEKFEFMFNSYAKRSNGDVYRVELNNEKDELFFLIKTGFTKLPFDIIDSYVKEKDLRNRNIRYVTKVRA